MTTGDAGRESGRRIAVLLEYDGTAYRGSQYQDNGPSIQAMLEAAINNLTSETVRAAFAGRTDAGVHALGQVAAFDTRSALSLAEFRGGLNHFLPPDIVARQVAVAPAGFDPRRCAIGRLYRYRIENRAVRPALNHHRVWHVARALDVAAMQGAANVLVGTHDFAAFAGTYEGATVRDLRRCAVERKGALVSVEMEAPSFLPHQVRRTVGPLVEVGLGRLKKEDLAALLEAARPGSAGPAAPPAGLCLVEVRYEGFGFGDAPGADDDGTG